MTTTEHASLGTGSATSAALYRDVHKGIRAELFAVTGDAGRVDPADDLARASLASRVRELVGLLEAHAGHEDVAVQPVLDDRLPDLAARIGADHQALATDAASLVSAAEAAAETTRRPGDAVHGLYLDLARYTSAYLAHQDVEERLVLPALEQAIGPEAVVAIHTAIVSSIPPEEMARSLAVMLPAMNVDGRFEVLSGVRGAAPAPVFEGVWGLAAAVLAPPDLAALGQRLGIA